jgi:hypothetical protein
MRPLFEHNAQRLSEVLHNRSRIYSGFTADDFESEVGACNRRATFHLLSIGLN